MNNFNLESKEEICYLSIEDELLIQVLNPYDLGKVFSEGVYEVFV